MRRLLGWLLAAACAGCALPQDVEWHIVKDGGEPVAKGFRFAGRAENPIEELTIDLRHAPRFLIRLPSGVWADSKTLTLDVLEKEGFERRTFERGGAAIWAADVGAATLVGRHQSMWFDLDASGVLKSVKLAACGREFRDALRAASGGRTYSLPMSVRELEALFGPVTQVERLAIVTGFTCL